MNPRPLDSELSPRYEPPARSLGAEALRYAFIALACLLALAALQTAVYLRIAPLFVAALVLSWAAGIAVFMSSIASLMLGIYACFVPGQRLRGIIAVVISVACAIAPRYLPRVW